ncbi:hypothetical protein L2E82_10349 [Cichorium intybus]|uniref:Uncharacterized protein n=1 Tax=Cichorium intybus TaxID=13427 RepID=A0ACB9G9T4_CICIN|nr:hypothetical protein L2E82_10349 [Cichorium intybus]
MLPRDAKSRQGDSGDWKEVRRKNLDNVINSFFVTNVQHDTTNKMLRDAFGGFGKLHDKSDRGPVGVMNQSKPLARSNFPEPVRRNADVRPGLSFAGAVGGIRTAAPSASLPLPPLILLESVPLLDAYDQLSLIGEVLCLKTLRELPKLIHADGRIPCKLLYAEGLKVVLKFNVSSSAELFFLKDYNWKRWFAWLKQGVLEDLKFDRLVCVKIHGLPIYLRSCENIAAITSKFGKVVEIDGHNWSSSNLSSAMARLISQSTTMINNDVVCTLNGKNYKIGIVEYEDIWDQIESYYRRSDPAGEDRENYDDYIVDGVQDVESNYSDEDDDGISDSCSLDLERMENWWVIPLSLSPGPELKGDKSHGDKTFLFPPPELPVLDDVIMDPLDLGDPLEPVPTLVGRESGPILLTPEFGPSHFNNGLSTSKRWRIDPSMHRLPRTSLSPRRLSGEFDLNVAIPNLSSVSGTANSERSKEVGILGSLKSKVDELELQAETTLLTEDERSIWRENKLKISELEGIEKLDLQQKAKVKWIKDGDENTLYFHEHGFNWGWCRDPSTLEELDELLRLYKGMEVLDGVVSSKFGFRFQLSTDGGYMVKDMRKALDSKLIL